MTSKFAALREKISSRPGAEERIEADVARMNVTPWSIRRKRRRLLAKGILVAAGLAFAAVMVASLGWLVSGAIVAVVGSFVAVGWAFAELVS